MKKKFGKKWLSVLLIFFTGVFAFGQESEPSNALSLYITTDAAYYPESDYKSGDSHFAPITGPFSAFECRSTLFADYTIKTPLGDHWLLADAELVVGGGLEFSPVSLRPQLTLTFQPLPFFLLSAGGSLGWGWNIAGFEGLCEFNDSSKEYEEVSCFTHPFYSTWAEATFMFDTGAIIEGDWTHLVSAASFKIYYSGIAGIKSGVPYEWQCSKNNVKGLQYECSFVLAYQMPLPLYRIGFMYSMDGHFDGDDYGDFDENYDGDFLCLSLSPLLQFKMGSKDSLFCLFEFSSRRSFSSYHEESEEELYLDAVAREWYFNRFALSWTHNF